MNMFLVKKNFEFESGSESESEDHESMGYQLLKPILWLAQQLELSSYGTCVNRSGIPYNLVQTFELQNGQIVDQGIFN